MLDFGRLVLQACRKNRQNKPIQNRALQWPPYGCLEGSFLQTPIIRGEEL